MAIIDDVMLLENDIKRRFDGVRTEITNFPSGAAMLDIWFMSRFFVLDYTPSTGWFRSDEVRNEDAFDAGCRFAFRDFNSAKEKMLSLLREAQQQTDAGTRHPPNG